MRLPSRIRRPARRPTVRPHLEALENRTVPAVFNLLVNPAADNAGAVNELIADITIANQNGQANTINLFPGGMYTLEAPNNYFYGPDGLPAITSNLTINGDPTRGATIQRDPNLPQDTADAFRFFYVSGGLELAPGSLTLNDLTLKNGLAKGGDSGGGGGGMGAGGAIFNQGVLTLDGVTLTQNLALGGAATLTQGVGGGGGMGQDPQAGGNGGGFDGQFISITTGGPGGAAGSSVTAGGGGGGGFLPTAAGASGDDAGETGYGGSGGGFGGFGGQIPRIPSVSNPPEDGGEGGAGGVGTAGASPNDGSGGAFGEGGEHALQAVGDSESIGGGGGGGGVGGGGGEGFSGNGVVGGGGGGGFGGGGGAAFGFGFAFGIGGDGGFGGGGGSGAGANGAGAGGAGGFGGGAGGITTVSFAIGVGGGGAGFGGAIFNMGAAPGDGLLTITNSTITGNTAQGGNGAGGGSGYGGAVFNLDGTVTLLDDTLAGNFVVAASGAGGPNGGSNGSVAGGAVYNLAYGNNIVTGLPVAATVSVANTILADNLATIFLQNNRPLELLATDLVSNAVNGAGPNVVLVTATGPNLIEIVGSGTKINGMQPISGADPLLGPLQYNGGPTPTMALLPSSPALDAGDNSLLSTGASTDQRGAPRVSGAAVDLGAYEAQGGGGDAFVTGTPGDDVLTISPAGPEGDITYVLDGGAPVTLSGVTSLTFRGDGGADVINVEKQGGPLVGAITFDGTGGSSLFLDVNGNPVQFQPGVVIIGDPQYVTYTNVTGLTVEGAASVGLAPAPDTADRDAAFAGLTPLERAVQALYLDDLGRPGSKAELDGWASMLPAAATSLPAQMVNGVGRSPEALDYLVRGWYVSALGRPAQGGEEQGWVNELLAGASEEQVLSQILASPEFYARAQTLAPGGMADENYVQALYQILLGRTASPGEVDRWVAALPSLGQVAVAYGILTSLEFRTNQFTGYYVALLHRPPAPAELSGWINSGLDIAGVMFSIEGSTAFFTDG